MAITFNCAACGKSLTTTDDKAGRKAKCPGCGEVVVVPGSAAEEELDTNERDDAGDDEFNNLPASPEKTTRDSGSKTCPMCGAENPRRAKTCTACGEKFEDVDDDQAGQRQSRIIDPGEVISASWRIYKNELGLVLGTVIVAMLINSAAGIPANVVNGIAEMQKLQGGDALGLALLSFVFQIAASVFSIFISIGQAKVLYRVARGKETSIGELFTGGPLFLKGLGASIVFGIMFIIGCLMLCIPGIIVFLMFWPFLYVLVDENPDGIDCLWRAKDISQGNWGASFILILFAIALFFLGLMALCIGLLFTMPLASLVFAVAYCHMTGQRTAE